MLRRVLMQPKLLKKESSKLLKKWKRLKQAENKRLKEQLVQKEEDVTSELSGRLKILEISKFVVLGALSGDPERKRRDSVFKYK